MKKIPAQLAFPLLIEVPGIVAGGLLSYELETLRAEWEQNGLPEPTCDDEAFVAALGYCPSCSEPLTMPCPEQCLLRHKHVGHLRKDRAKQ